jgi:hypothetical protein
MNILPIRGIDAEVPFHGGRLGSVILVFTAVMAATTWGLLTGLIAFWVFYASWIAGFAGLAFAAMRYVNAAANQMGKYRELLAEIATSDLVRLAESPELDERSRSAIVAHLNATSPGWSMNAAG